MDQSQPKRIPLIVILGPTSAGKTALSLELAERFNGEIVSADSRQVYRGLDIGTSKVTLEEQGRIPHHLIDVIDPQEQMSIAVYKELADDAIADIYARGKLPFLVGGSALYIYSVVDNYQIPQVVEDSAYRAELEAMDNAKRLTLLQREDPRTYEVIDRDNPRRVIRALEVVRVTGRSFQDFQTKGESKYNALFIGIDRPREELYARIDACVDRRMQQGLIDEVQGLLAVGVSPERLIKFGLEYRFVMRYLQGELSREDMIQQLKYATHDFARRQMTWFRRDKRVRWLAQNDQNDAIIRAHLSV